MDNLTNRKIIQRIGHRGYHLSPKDRILARSHMEHRGYIDPTGEPSKCLIFDGTWAKDNYRRIRVNGKWKPAHRVMKGEPPFPDAEPDHLCRQRDCVRPSHLEWVTHSENVRRANVLRGKPAPEGKGTEPEEQGGGS